MRPTVALRWGVALVAGGLLLAGCSGGGGRSVPSDAFSDAPSPTSSGIERPLAVKGNELNICRAFPVDVMSSLVNQPIRKAAAGTAGGTLLGECDYAVNTVAAAASPQPGQAMLKQVYVSARPNSVYDTFVSTYAASATTVQVGTTSMPAAFSPSAGLLVKVPHSDYFLQIAAVGIFGLFLQPPAAAIATYYLGG